MDTQLQTLDEPTMFEQLAESSVLLEEPIGDEDEFYYGYRTLVFDGPDGKPIYRYRPLTLADFLDPEEGDVLTQGTLHFSDTRRLYRIFTYLHRDNPRLSVFGDFNILWGIPGLFEPAPDHIPHRRGGEPPVPHEVALQIQYSPQAWG